MLSLEILLIGAGAALMISAASWTTLTRRFAPLHEGTFARVHTPDAFAVLDEPLAVAQEPAVAHEPKKLVARVVSDSLKESLDLLSDDGLFVMSEVKAYHCQRGGSLIHSAPAARYAAQLRRTRSRKNALKAIRELPEPADDRLLTAEFLVLAAIDWAPQLRRSTSASSASSSSLRSVDELRGEVIDVPVRYTKTPLRDSNKLLDGKDDRFVMSRIKEESWRLGGPRGSIFWVWSSPSQDADCSLATVDE